MNEAPPRPTKHPFRGAPLWVGVALAATMVVWAHTPDPKNDLQHIARGMLSGEGGVKASAVWDVSYDIQKTNSITSPYTAHIIYYELDRTRRIEADLAWRESRWVLMRHRIVLEDETRAPVLRTFIDPIALRRMLMTSYGEKP